MSTIPSGFRAPFETVTDSDHTAWIVITAALGIIYSLIFLAFRIFVRRTSGLGRLTSDDAAIVLATLLAVVQSSVILGACQKGLGKQWLILSGEEQQEVQRMIYAAALLFVLALVASKVSVFLFLLNLTATRSQRRVFLAVTAGVAVWGVASVLALALQCDLSQPWQTFGAICSGSAVRWQAISAFDVIFELLAVALATYLVWGVQISISKKWTVVSAFAARLLTVVTTAFRLASFDQQALTTDPSFEAHFHVWLQVGMHISMITATVLILRPVIYNLNTNYGTLGPTISHAYGGGSADAYAMSNMSNAKRSQKAGTNTQSFVDPRGVDTVASAMGGQGKIGGQHIDGETESVESGSSQRMIIKKKTTWQVETSSKGTEDYSRQSVIRE